MNLIRKFILLFLLLFCIQGIAPLNAAPPFVWEEISVKGRVYVPIDNVRAFYGLTTPVRTEGGWHIIANKSTEISFKANSQQMKANRLLFILSYPVIPAADGRLLISRVDVIKILEPVLRPDKIRDGGRIDVIVLDPGHGGKDAGATNHMAREADLNLKLARLTRTKLQNAGFKVVMTRDSDVFLTLQQRVDIANRHKNAIFISIHFNSGGRNAHGIETFTLNPRGSNPSNTSFWGNTRDSANIILATAVQGTVMNKLGAEDRGIKRARFSVLCNVQHPAVLFEGGFMSNSREAQLLMKDDYLNKMAAYLTESVVKYKKAIQKTK